MNGEGFLIRRMCADDVVPAMRIAESMPHAPHWTREVYLTTLDTHAAAPRLALVAADPANDAPIGFAIARVAAHQAELEMIAVRGNWQRKGVGRALLNRLIIEMRQEGVLAMWLEVRVSNRAANRLYDRVGFEETSRRKDYYTNPVEDAIVMRLTFS